MDFENNNVENKDFEIIEANGKKARGLNKRKDIIKIVSTLACGVVIGAGSMFFYMQSQMPQMPEGMNGMNGMNGMSKTEKNRELPEGMTEEDMLQMKENRNSFPGTEIQ